MSDLVRQASQEIEDKQNKYIYDVLMAAASVWEAPFYGTGTGVVKATLNPMLQHWMRLGGATIVGDIAIISQLAELTGFAADTTKKQFAGPIIEEYNANGFIGRYYGADVVQLTNAYGRDGVTPLVDTNALFIMPKGISQDLRPLKILREGDVQSMDATHIDDLSYEIRLDQNFGAGVVIGKKPYMSVYQSV